MNYYTAVICSQVWMAAGIVGSDRPAIQVACIAMGVLWFVPAWWQRNFSNGPKQ